MATKNKIMLDCLRQLSMVYGTSTNTYAEDKLYAMIDDALETVFKENFWQRHVKKLKVNLVNGYCENENIYHVLREFEDIQCIMNNNNYPVELPKANLNVIADTQGSSSPLCYQFAHENPEKIFRCLPPGTGTVWVVFRTLCKPSVYTKFINNGLIITESDRPFVYLPEDEIPFDALAIKYRTCYNYMIIKGDNDMAAANFDRMYKERMQKLFDEETNNTLSFTNGTDGRYSNGWYDNG